MTIHFFIKYRTSFGETLFISGDHALLGGGGLQKALPMKYYNDAFWHVIVEFPTTKFTGKKPVSEKVSYQYFMKDQAGIDVFEGEIDRYVELAESGTESVSVIDTWIAAGDVENIYFTEAFNKVLLPKMDKVKIDEIENYTHEFRIKVPLLKPSYAIVLLGSTKNLKSWDVADPIFLNLKNNWFTGRVHLNDNEWPATYKYGIYDLEKKKVVQLEAGENRILYKKKEGVTIFQDGYLNYSPEFWKGGGVSIPVFSLRSNNGFGVGEFSDLKLLIDWAKKTRLQLIQILPVNDTIAHKNWSDSYPYSAISAFALHPVYINLDKIAGKESEAILEPFRKKHRLLNLSPTVDYDKVMDLKTTCLKELFKEQKGAFQKNKDFKVFFDENKDWLIPYAAFCYLRDKNKTSDFSKWKTYSGYDKTSIDKLVSPSQKNYESILFFYFVQYHLHLQLKEVADYASEQKVVLKGDIPIGIYRHSCDAWVNPSLYNMAEQAGAPPDDFAVKGQNWGFPTYNWDKMKEDNFGWWRRRFKQMNAYFDAFRIDHILGFFRIWSIPIDAVEGILGRFVPAIPIDISEFKQNHIFFDYERFCQPFITDSILEEMFQERKEEVKNNYLEIIGDKQYHLKEFVNTQRKVADYFSKNEDTELKEGLFNLISNVLFIVEENSDKKKFHCRFDMEHTTSFLYLDPGTQERLKELYLNYFYHRQNDFWRKEGMDKLPALKRSTKMLIFGEDLGMVPPCVPEVMNDLGILGLEIERMPKKSGQEFFHPKNAPYMSTVTPGTHDMSTIRGWWEENPDITQKFYNHMLGHYGEAPKECAPWISKEILLQHFYSPAMWCIIQIQDMFGIDENLRLADPKDERINIPADPYHRWNYRMQTTLETLLKEDSFNEQIKKYIVDCGRST